MDDTPAVTRFAETLERVCVETVESGQMTKDLALLIGPDQPWLTTQEFLAAIDDNLKKAAIG
jgi:isocitrate dehydrogenase